MPQLQTFVRRTLPLALALTTSCSPSGKEDPSAGSSDPTNPTPATTVTMPLARTNISVAPARELAAVYPPPPAPAGYQRYRLTDPQLFSPGMVGALDYAFSSLAVIFRSAGDNRAAVIPNLRIRPLDQSEITQGATNLLFRWDPASATLFANTNELRELCRYPIALLAACANQTFRAANFTNVTSTPLEALDNLERASAQEVRDLGLIEVMWRQVNVAPLVLEIWRSDVNLSRANAEADRAMYALRAALCRAGEALTSIEPDAFEHAGLSRPATAVLPQVVPPARPSLSRYANSLLQGGVELGQARPIREVAEELGRRFLDAAHTPLPPIDRVFAAYDLYTDGLSLGAHPDAHRFRAIDFHGLWPLIQNYRAAESNVPPASVRFNAALSDFDRVRGVTP